MGAAPKWMRWLPGVALVAALAVLFLPGFASLRSTGNGAGPSSPELTPFVHGDAPLGALGPGALVARGGSNTLGRRLRDVCDREEPTRRRVGEIGSVRPIPLAPATNEAIGAREVHQEGRIVSLGVEEDVVPAQL